MEKGIKGKTYERKKRKVVPKRKIVAAVVKNHVKCQQQKLTLLPKR